MKVTVLAPIYGSREIGYAHALMFHGFWPGRKTNADPYAVQRNVFLMPDVFSPAPGIWVVSEALKDKVKPFPSPDLKEVTFTRLIDAPWNVGEAVRIPTEAFEDDALGGGIDRAKFFAAFPLASAARRKVGRYYIYAPPCAYIECDKRRYRGMEPVTFDFTEMASKDTFVYPASSGHNLSIKMVEDFPVIQNDGYLFFTGKAFGVIEPHLDMRFFIRGELDLGRRTRRCT